jgi:hypothetical protein
MKEQIKELRVEIDGLAQLCEGLKPIKDGAAIHNRLRNLDLLSIHSTEYERAVHKAKYEKEYDEVIRKTSRNTEEIKEAVKSLKLSKAWLGKVLESLGSKNPYGSGYKTAEDIVPETDKAKTVCGIAGIPGKTIRLEAIDTFTINGKVMNEYCQMSHIEKVDWLRTEIKQLVEKLVIMQIENKAYYNTIYQYLLEARFWLGFELGRVRDESK